MNIHVTSVARCLEIYFRYRFISGMCIRFVLGNEKGQTLQQPDQSEQEQAKVSCVRYN